MGLFNLFGKKGTTNADNTTITGSTAEELFLEGKKCEKEAPERAFKLFLESAQKGYPDAMNKVGYSYLYQGCGTEFDIEKSAYWFEQGAKKGQTGCMILISQFYMSGVGVRENDETAKYWLKMAIQSGNEKAATVAQKRLVDYETNKAVVTGIMQTAVKSNGMPNGMLK